MDIGCEQPRCVVCGNVMHFVKSFPAPGNLPELRTFNCDPCEQTVLVSIPPEPFDAAALWEADASGG